MFASKNFFLGSTAKPFSISYVGRVGVQVGGNTTSETYAGASIGTADPTRILVIVVTGANNAGAAGGTTSVTVDGNPMTAQDCYVVTDSNPVSQYEVLHWITAQMGMEASSEVPEVVGGKRMSNQRMLSTGFSLKYPDYKVGYSAMLNTA